MFSGVNGTRGGNMTVEDVTDIYARAIEVTDDFESEDPGEIARVVLEARDAAKDLAKASDRLEAMVYELTP
jgi:hypothetical protein